MVVPIALQTRLSVAATTVSPSPDVGHWLLLDTSIFSSPSSIVMSAFVADEIACASAWRAPTMWIAMSSTYTLKRELVQGEVRSDEQGWWKARVRSHPQVVPPVLIARFVPMALLGRR